MDTESTTHHYSMTHNYHKARWPRGAWDDEPDRVDFLHAGFSCFLLRNPHGVWCGYVGVPADHPCYKMSYNDVDVTVHGGLTYAGLCDPPICHVPAPGLPDDVWWLGFDTNHGGDFAPGMSDAHEVDRQFGLGGRDVYRTVAYARAETQQLADQLRALAAP